MGMDWHVGWWSELPETGGPGTTFLELITQEELQTLYEHDVIVERVIGQYYLRPDPATVEPTDGQLIHTRLTVRQVDPEATLFSMPVWSFTQAEERFMWHKVHLFGAAVGLSNWKDHPEWSHIDVRVNRRLSDLESLAFAIDGTGTWNNTSPSYSYGAWIRVLVKH